MKWSCERATRGTRRSRRPRRRRSGRRRRSRSAPSGAPRSAIAAKSSTARRTSPSTERTESASCSSAGVVEPPVELEVHHRLARVRLARVQHARDAAVVVALEPDDRVQHALDADALRDELRAHRVDQERQVLGVRLEHRAGALVAVLGRRRVERAHDDRAVAARGGEVEHAGDLGEQLRAGSSTRPRRPRAASGRRRRTPRSTVPSLAALARDQRHQPVAHGRDRVLPRLD